MRSIPYFFGVLVILTGCATGRLSSPGTFLPPEHNLILAQAKPCCSSYFEFPYLKLGIEQETSVIVSPESPVFDFPGGRSFFAAFELPTGSQAMVLKTYAVNMLYNPSGHVLVPSVQFLDLNHRIIETSRPKYIERGPRIIGDSWGEANILIPLSARYVILMDGKSSLGLSWRDRDQRTGFLFTRSGPTGELSILVRRG